MSGDRQVVSNAGPLMALAKLNLLHLLKDLYGRVRIPSAVYDEIVTVGLQRGYQDARTLYIFLNQVGWKPEQVAPAAISARLSEAAIDHGEREALALAITLDHVLLLMDEMAGRALARREGIAVRGTLGVLNEAYQRRLIREDQLRLYFAEIARRQDIWIRSDVVERLLREILGDANRDPG
jgi:predicted nucleic acid-binding protein